MIRHQAETEQQKYPARRSVRTQFASFNFPRSPVRAIRQDQTARPMDAMILVADRPDF
jgi:hypothetical protein